MTATSAFGLGKRRSSSPQWCQLHRPPYLPSLGSTLKVQTSTTFGPLGKFLTLLSKCPLQDPRTGKGVHGQLWEMEVPQ